MANLKTQIDGDDMFIDCAVIAHGYAPHFRDYNVIIEVPAAKPDGRASYVMGRYLYRFTHCPEVRITSAVKDDTWKVSWEDHFLDFGEWERAGNPAGFVWGVKYADAYPGLSYVAGSESAAIWTQRFGRDMHEILIETNTFELRLVCHDCDIETLALGDPETGKLVDVVTGEVSETSGQERTVIPLPPDH